MNTIPMDGVELGLFLVLAETIASQRVQTLEMLVEVLKSPTKGEIRETAKFAEPLIVEFLEKAIAKRRMML